jgi:hypothetical protein
MIFTQFSTTPLSQRLNVILTRWHGLIKIASKAYRPEHHYMRGPGPKWYEKHQGRIENEPDIGESRRCIGGLAPASEEAMR